VRYSLILGSEGHYFAIKEYLDQLINLYEIINSVLQDIENSITFAKINVMHPSIIKTNELYKELLKIEKRLDNNKLPFKITLENTFIIQKFIDIECYISNNKITYFLKVPVMQVFNFKYYHLYSAPIFNGSQFKALVPRNKFLLKNELYHTFTSDPCKKATPQDYICQKLSLEESAVNEPCEVRVLNNKNTSACQKIQVVVTRSRILPIDETNQLIGIFPEPEVVKLNCNHHIESVRLQGSFLFNVPRSCELLTNQGRFLINEPITNSQSMILPKIEEPIAPDESSFQVHLEDIKLDELHAVKFQVLQNPPFHPLAQNPIFGFSSLWTMFIYVLMVFAVSYCCYKSSCLRDARRSPRFQNKSMLEMFNFNFSP